jgi:hypothetical protein
MWGQIIADTITNPREAARQVMKMNLPVSFCWQALLLLLIMQIILSTGAFWIAGGDAWKVAAENNLFVSVAFQWATSMLGVILMQGVGQWAGGQGRFADALALAVWMQAILSILQIGQCLAIVLIPQLLIPIWTVGVVLAFWMLSYFVAELHGFQNVLKVFAVIFGFMFVVGLAIAPFLDPALMEAR